MKRHSPLPTLLSQVLVAFTIEFDNEAEHQIPHRTTRHGSTGEAHQGPWLISMVMWWNCMRFIDDSGVRVRDLVRRARTKTNFRGMARWGYISVKPDPDDGRRPEPPRSEWIVRATEKGRMAQEVCRPLTGTIETRWRKRFGNSAIQQLRESLSHIVDRIPFELPDCMPILGYGLVSLGRARVRRLTAGQKDCDGASLALPALLARVLLIFTLQFERKSTVSLAICANVLRLLDEKETRVRDLPLLSGVSKESISMAIGYLVNKELALVAAAPELGRARVVGLTPEGLEAKHEYERLLASVEEHWRTRLGPEMIDTLRASLEKLAGDGTSKSSPLFQGLEPYPDNWRASVRKRETLPHFPMVLHRGGFPDGS